MTVRETYDYLLQIKKLETRIQNLILKCDALRSCLLPSGIRYDLDNVQTSPSDHMSEIEAQVLDMEKTIMEMQKQKSLLINEISQSISKLPDESEQTVLLSYYIARKQMEQVAVTIGYSISHAYRIKRNAIKHLARLI